MQNLDKPKLSIFMDEILAMYGFDEKFKIKFCEKGTQYDY